MYCVCPNISSLPLIFVLVCIQEKRYEYSMQSEKITQKEDRNTLICLGVTGKQEMRISISTGLLESSDVARKKRPSVNCSKYIYKNTSFSLLLAVIHVLTCTLPLQPQGHCFIVE